ncbi:MAG: hypothetical protein QHH14_10675 [Clostridiales bacterium]|nr:hypothetical protein [Clostridiales bacterium]
MTVTAVEIPVRVLLKGDAVRDLTKEDFEVYENGIKQEITQFEVISRKIAGPALPGQKPGIQKRLFLLIFNIFDYDNAVGAAVDDFFREIFRPGDQVVVLTEGRVLNVERGKGVEELAAAIKDSLHKFKAISTAAALKNFRDISYEADRLLSALRGQSAERMSIAPVMIRFFENYQRIWTDYRRQFLEQDVDFYQSLIKRLKSIEGDKWAIAFQQREMFPRIKNASRLDNEIRAWADSQVEPQQQVDARMVQARQQDLQRAFDFSGTINAEAMSDIFLGAGFTFHLILMKSLRTIFSQDLELKEVGKDFEESLTRISRLTGGYLGFSNQPAAALKEAAALEDFHYLLVYSPRETSGGKKRNIEVKVKRSGVDVVHLKNYLSAGSLQVAVEDFKVNGRTISFTLSHYEMTQINGKRRGLADVKITIIDESSNKVFDEGKSLDLFKDETHISLNFNRLKPGTYFIIIQAVDRVSNQSDVYSGLIKL